MYKSEEPKKCDDELGKGGPVVVVSVEVGSIVVEFDAKGGEQREGKESDGE